jgi:hypothetical protein
LAHNTGRQRRAINASERSRLGNSVADEAEIVQSYLASRRQRDPCCREIGYGLCPCERTNRQVTSANLGPPAGEVDVAPAKLPADIERSEPEALQANRVEADPYLAFHATDTLDSSHPAHPLQLADDHILHEPGDLLGRLPRRDCGIGEDGQAGDVDALATAHRLYVAVARTRVTASLTSLERDRCQFRAETRRLLSTTHP